MKKVYLDFDGTVVEHEYPRIGRCNFGCFEVIKKLQDAGHEIILNTARADFNDGTLEKAMEYMNEDSWMFFIDKKSEIRPIICVKHKIHPHPWKLDDVDVIFIDDICYGILLKPCKMIQGNMVDWDELDRQFILKNIY